MSKIKVFIAIGIFLMSFSFSIAQIGEGGTPHTFGNSSCKSQGSVHCIHLPLVDNNALRVADSLAQLNDSTNSFNFGITLQANYNMNNSGTWDTLSDGSRIWRLHIVSQGSYASYLLFDNFYLPQNSKFFAYSEDRTHILGAFTSSNNKPYQKFSMGPIKGGSIILEYYEPTETDTFPTISISFFVHSFKDVYEIHNDLNNSGACHINVRCPQGNGWCNQRRSVALVTVISSTSGHLNKHCSGSLLTNERRDGRPYFLTADHCIDVYDNDPSNFIFIFNYQSQDCNNPPTAPSTAFSISGATLIANHSNSDFGLLELSSRPPGNFNVYYNGWSNDKEDMSGDGVIIHHPDGDIKKLLYGIK